MPEVVVLNWLLVIVMLYHDCFSCVCVCVRTYHFAVQDSADSNGKEILSS